MRNWLDDKKNTFPIHASTLILVVDYYYTTHNVTMLEVMTHELLCNVSNVTRNMVLQTDHIIRL